MCVCVCAHGGKWQRLQSNGQALSDSDEWHRPSTSGAERDWRSTGRCSAPERARIQTNPALRLKRYKVRNTSKAQSTLGARRAALLETNARVYLGRAVVVAGRTKGLELCYDLRIALFFTWPNGKHPKRKTPRVKRKSRRQEEHRRIRWVLSLRSKTVLSGGGRTAIVTPLRVRTGGRARHAPPPAYRPRTSTRRKKALATVLTTTTPPH